MGWAGWVKASNDDLQWVASLANKAGLLASLANQANQRPPQVGNFTDFQ